MGIYTHLHASQMLRRDEHDRTLSYALVDPVNKICFWATYLWSYVRKHYFQCGASGTPQERFGDVSGTRHEHSSHTAATRRERLDNAKPQLLGCFDMDTYVPALMLCKLQVHACL